MSKLLLLELIAKYGLPAALQIVEIFKSSATVDEMLPRLKQLGLRSAADYEAAPQA